METRRSGSGYYESDEKLRDNKLKSSRSKSHDESERSNRRERSKRVSEEYYEQKSSDENQPAPFYLHSTASQNTSSHNGYERIQSLFYESLEHLERQEVDNGKKTHRRNREMSPEKTVVDLHRRDPNNNKSSSSSQYSHQRRKSPKRRAAPAMLLPGVDYKG